MKPVPSSSRHRLKSGLLTAGVCAAALFAATGLNAATLTFNSPATNFSDTSVLDTPLSSFTGATLVGAVNYGSGAVTVTTVANQTINFINGGTTGLTNAGVQNQVTLFTGTTGNTSFNTFLKGGAYHSTVNESTPLTLTLTGLTNGVNYAVLLFSADARTSDRTQAYYDNSSFTGGSSSFSQNSPSMVMATFTADSTSQVIYIHATDVVGNPDTNLSGYTLYSYTSAIPEPSTYAVIVGAIALGGVITRRRANRCSSALSV